MKNQINEASNLMKEAEQHRDLQIQKLTDQITSLFPNEPIKTVNLSFVGELRMWIGETGGIYINLYYFEDCYTVTEIEDFNSVIRHPDHEFHCLEDFLDHMVDNYSK